MTKNLDRITNEVFLSIDGEFDGDCPPVNSMLQLGVQPFSLAEGFIGNGHEINFKTLPGSTMSPTVKDFWDQHPEAYEATRVDQMDPEDGMHMFKYLLHRDLGYREIIKRNEVRGIFGTHPIIASYPDIDFVWLYWYCHMFLGHSPFGWASADFKSEASIILSRKFGDTNKAHMPKHWFNFSRPGRLPHTALSDAKDQAHTMIVAKCEHYGLAIPKNIG